MQDKLIDIEQLGIHTLSSAQKVLKWGTYGKNGDQPLKWVRFIDLSTEHIKNILMSQKQLDIHPNLKDVLEYVLFTREAKFTPMTDDNTIVDLTELGFGIMSIENAKYELTFGESCFDELDTRILQTIKKNMGSIPGIVVVIDNIIDNREKVIDNNDEMMYYEIYLNDTLMGWCDSQDTGDVLESYPNVVFRSIDKRTFDFVSKRGFNKFR